MGARSSDSAPEWVLVTGGTGFLGHALVHRLLDDGRRVRLLVRSPEKAAEFARRGAQIVPGDITDAATVRKAVRGTGLVYHLAGRLMVPGVPEHEYRTTHVDGTNRIIESCLEAGSVRRVVHCSTTGVLGVTGERPADEGAPYGPTNVYESTKAEEEEAVRGAIQAGLPAVIVRPGLVYGPGDLHLLGFFRAILRRQFRPIGRRPVWLHPIYIDDMSAALLVCGHHLAAVGECFHVAGPEVVTLSGLATAIAAAGGTSLPPGHIPMMAARTAAMVGDWLPGNLRRAVPLTTTRLDFLTHSRFYSVDKARQVLGFVANTTLADGIARTVDWYRQQHHLPLASTA